MWKILVVIISISACNQPKSQIQSYGSTPLEQTQSVQKIKYDDPVFFMSSGTPFPQYIQMLWKQGKFETMLVWTSEQTIRKFGRKRLLKYYSEELQFGYFLGKLSNENRTE